VVGAGKMALAARHLYAGCTRIVVTNRSPQSRALAAEADGQEALGAREHLVEATS
jgi:threonine dehydrogenase-like Zn-dependent dehydrogenase